MIETLKHMLTIGPVKVIFDNHNNNRERFLYKRGESLGRLSVVVFSYIQVAGRETASSLCVILPARNAQEISQNNNSERVRSKS